MVKIVHFTYILSELKNYLLSATRSPKVGQLKPVLVNPLAYLIADPGSFPLYTLSKESNGVGIQGSYHGRKRYKYRIAG